MANQDGTIPAAKPPGEEGALRPLQPAPSTLPAVPETEEQFAEFVRRNQKNLYRRAVRWLRDPELAQDVVQDALARGHRAWRSGRVESSLLGVMGQELYWRILRVSEKNRREREQILAGGLGDAIDELPTDQVGALDRLLARDASGILEAAVGRALGRLPEIYRRVIELRFFQAMTRREIAETMETSEETIKSRIHRALKKLQADPDLCSAYAAALLLLLLPRLLGPLDPGAFAEVWKDPGLRADLALFTDCIDTERRLS